MASGFDKQELMNYLLETIPEGLELLDKSEMTPLFYSVRQNHFKMTEFLLKKGANVKHRDSKLSTPFYLSVLYAGFEVFKLLMEYGSEINMQNSYKRSPLMKAIYLCMEDKSQALLNEKDININLKDSNGRNILHMACWGNRGGRKGYH